MNIFKRLTRYPKQVISSKALDLIELLDNHLCEIHTANCSEVTDLRSAYMMKIKSVEVPLMNQFLPISVIFNQMKSSIMKSDYATQSSTAYLPRSVAFITEADGTWVFIYAVRDKIGSSRISTKMFIDCLNRTNNSRSKICERGSELPL